MSLNSWRNQGSKKVFMKDVAVGVWKTEMIWLYVDKGKGIWVEVGQLECLLERARRCYTRNGV